MFPRLRDLREDKGMTQEDVAKYLSVSQTTYSRYESGALDIPTLSLIKLAGFYQMSTDYILGLTDERRPYKKSRN